MNRDQLTTWIAAYERAWRSPGADVLAELFAPDATYAMTPYQQPSDGVAQIAALWERERDGPDEVFTMDSDIVAVEGDTGVVRVHVTYGAPVEDEFLDLWIIRLDEIGRCTAFEEWAFPAD